MRWAEVTALLGGTFDPPHRGHRLALEGVIRDLAITRAFVLPSSTPPHKPALASAEDRLAMTRLCFEGLAEAEIDLREIRRGESGSPTYSYDTLLELQREIRETAFVIGADQLEMLPTWYRFPEILGLCHWIVLERKPEGHKKIRQALSPLQASGLVRTTGAWNNWWVTNGKTLHILPTEAPEISSTRIRESIARDGKPPTGTLMPHVEAYLMHKGLYGMGQQR